MIRPPTVWFTLFYVLHPALQCCRLENGFRDLTANIDR
jgi:hypothetical protein